VNAWAARDQQRQALQSEWIVAFEINLKMRHQRQLRSSLANPAHCLDKLAPTSAEREL
jgi:hypothetical protein